MSIRVVDILSNPFRDLKRNPIPQSKVEILKGSIQQTTFWDNIVVRPHPEKEGKYQLAYGHSRLEALTQLSIEKIEIPIRELSDAIMIQMMANENYQQDKMSLKVLNETVSVAKTFLDGELAKYGSWEELTTENKLIRGLFDKPMELRRFQQLKSEGVGHTTIKKFLGAGWNQDAIQNALHTITNKETIDREAVELLKNPTHSREFKRVMEEKNVPKGDQKEIAEKIVKDLGSGPIAPGSTSSEWTEKLHNKMLHTVAEHYGEEPDEKDLIFVELEKDIKSLTERLKSATIAAKILNHTFNKHQMTELGEGLAQFLTAMDVYNLLKELKPILDIFQIDYSSGRLFLNE